MLKKTRRILFFAVAFIFVFNIAFAKNNAFVIYYYTKGYLELYKGEFNKSARDLWLVFPYVVDADFYNQLSDILVYKGQYYKAQLVLQRAIKVYPKKKGFYYKLFDVYTIEGKTKDAEKLMSEIRKRFKYTPNTVKRLALMYMRSSNYKKAYELLVNYLKKKNKDADAHFYLANVCLKLKDIECALKEAKLACDLNFSPRYALFLANLYEQIGRFKRAINIYKRLPKNGFTMYAIGNDYYLLGDFKKSEKFFSYAFSFSKRVDYLEKLAFVDIQLKRYDKIISLCRKYRKFVNESDRLKLFCAVALSRKNYYVKALNLLSRINKNVMFYKDVILNEIYCYFKLNDFNEINKLLNRYGNVGMYFTVASELYVRDGKIRDAIKLLKDALKKVKSVREQSDIYLYMADLYYEKLKDKKDTIKILKELLSINPDYPEGLNYLGYLYIDKNINVRKGIELVKRALKKEKDNPYYLDSLGWGYFKLGEYKKAIFYLKEALKNYEESKKSAIVVTLGHLLSVYDKIGDRKEALKVAKEILKIDPENKRAREFLSGK